MKKATFFALSAAALIAFSPMTARAGCASADRICNDAVNNQAARQRAADDARTKELNRQNGTSQYTGPIVGRSQNGTPYLGYKKSTP